MDKRFQVFRPLQIGQRVISKTWKKGASGVIAERLDDSLSGLSRYGVRMDFNDNIADFCRYELSVIK